MATTPPHPDPHSGPPRRPTQVDLARAAEVSQATVSLIINETPDRPSRVSEQTRERVLSAAARLGYTMNAAARALKGGRNHLLGLYTFEAMFPVDQRDFYFPFLLGVEERAAELGYDLLLFSASAGRARRGVYEDGSNRLKVADGCVLLGRHVDRDVLERMRADGFPFVFIGRRETETGAIDYVAPDYRGATAELVRTLADTGHRRPVLIRQPDGEEPGEDRLAGFLAGCNQAGLEVEDAQVVEGVPTAEQVAAWHRDGADALLVEPSEDDSALEAVELACAAAGVAVPADLTLAVLGDPQRTPGSPDWMRLELPRADLGRAAVSLLTDILDDGDAPRHQLMACTLVVGDTFAPRGARA
ncbi:LacI family DNA-binding transcriptional regulator [Cellulomonas sp.]|uniref:LacI family DNA-binding transcriptional regulator n=1 Tax=Cellulomonas sp. TaxID=40001 RepID=UPI0025C0A0E6|nr:LacI family DNA-binding transcriptional regulator [Cellulomonas sp.]